MTIASVPRIQINGAIDTKQNVMANINNIATNSQSWVTWDTTIAKWRIIANAPTATSTQYTFDDSTIIGGIGVTGTPIERMYNVAEIRFNNDELRDDIDSLGIRLPTSELYPNESENAVNLNYTLINNPIHAQILGSIELLQSRLDKVITFTTDFSSAGLTAGEVIQVNAPIYGYTNKLFRVTSIEEADSDDGGILFTISAIEYNSSVYSSTLQRDQRTKATDIIPFELNNCVQDSEAEDTLEDIFKTGACVILATLQSPTINMTGDEVPTSMSDFDFYSDLIYDNDLGVFVPSDIFDPNQTEHRYNLATSYTAPRDGFYRLNYYVSRAAVYATDGAGDIIAPEKFRTRWQLCLKLGETYVTRGVTSPNSDRQLIPSSTNWPWREDGINLQKGQTVEFLMFFMTDFGPSNPGYAPETRFGFSVGMKIVFCGSDNGY